MEKGYEKLIKDLNNLPKVDAPEDFDYKLMVKIRNGQFDSSRAKEDSGRLWKFIPATAFALSALIIFFVVKESSVENTNPYLEANEQAQIAENANEPVNLRAPASSQNKDSYAVVQPNDVIKKHNNAPVPRLKGVDVDNLIDGQIRDTRGPGNPHVVSNGNNFNGFLIDKDRKEIARLRAKLDSIKAAEKKKKNGK